MRTNTVWISLTVVAAAASFLVVGCSQPPEQEGEAFRDAVEDPPPDWTGAVFQLSHDYPATRPDPPDGGYPWSSIDFEESPREYVMAVFGYARAALADVDWQPVDLAEPDWFHAPWMSVGDAKSTAREFIHGLTGERHSRPDELIPGQTEWYSNYAVGIYNAAGGYTFGQVWADPDDPDVSKARFPEGTMAVKLLFTDAPVSVVPYLEGSKEWEANVYDKTSGKREPATLRLLQVDVAVRDSRNPLTGWLLGTFVYDGTQGNADPLDNLMPVGLMWGNDPGVLPGGELEQQWINPDLTVMQHLGWPSTIGGPLTGRLNGPVDNPVSSCMSCHGHSQTPMGSPMVPPDEWPEGSRMVPEDRWGEPLTDEERLLWFRNIQAGESFDPGSQSLDYSLQLAVGVKNALAAKKGAAAKATADDEHPITRGDRRE